ncbi:ABC transporter permease [Desulfomonile tiedjei]|uniref:ABC-type transport system, involved in lipoprotein release, permease component n=1 Tax=Desulfomonile tiedjei (strain ATCC 49306 / DSM 6799 / DCB-1) TaxID=706587 RepID=I4C117_DESTA|nr:ABC transporter permease [Desulfomonile tiedjei]AFM23258.1 ABC-type transport system, involved in lipoprotein release, permease component [Desulfomonile tiedjei DSM 6799]
MSRVLTRKLLRDLWQRRRSLIALIAIVTVGVGVYVTLASVHLDLDGARIRYYDRYRLSDFTVDVKRAPEWTIEVVRTLPNVKEARGRVYLQVLLDLKSAQRPIPGVALSMPGHRADVIDGIMMRSGAWFSSDNSAEAILEHQFAEANHIGPGDRIKVTLLDKQHNLLVVGTAMSPEFVYLIPPGGGLSPDPAGYGVMFLPQRFLQDAADLSGAYNQVVGLAADNSRNALEDTLKVIKSELDEYGVTNTTPIQDQPSASIIRDELQNLKTTAAIYPTIFLGFAALILNILVSRMVIQQRVVVGTLRALGFSAGAVTRHFLGYGLIIGILGGIGGLVFGWWLQNAMLGMYRQFFAMPGIVGRFHWHIHLQGLAIAVVFALLGAWRGSRRAAGLEPAEAMRPPPPEKGGRILLERISVLWGPLSFHWKMILRAVFRNPFRSSVSILAAAVATAIMLTSFSTYDSTYFLMNYHFKKLSHYDLIISLRDPKGMSARSEAQNLPGVSFAEPQLDVLCDLKNGPYEKRTAVTGLPPKHMLFTPLDRSGRDLVVPDEGIILTEKLAEILHVHVGDKIRLRPLIARRTEVEAPVMGVVHTFLGLSAYCNLHYLSGLLGEYQVTGSFLVKEYPGAPERPLMKQIGIRPAVTSVTERLRALHQMEATMAQFIGAMFGITVLFAGVIAFGSLLNTALVSLSEREREVGTLRVLGYTSAQVAKIFAWESILLNAVGTILGLGLGVGLAHLISLAFDTELYRFPAVILPSKVLISVAAMALFVAVGQLIVYRMIRSLPWLDVLKVKE